MLKTLQILSDITFLRGLAWAVTQILLAALVGGAVGVVVGALIRRCGYLSGSMIHFLHIAIWIPLVLYWALPVWDPWRLNLSQVFVAVLFSNSLVIMLSSAHSYLLVRMNLNLDRKNIIWWVARTTLLRSLFVCLFSQFWLGHFGWNWYEFGPPGAQAATLLILLLVFLIERLLHTRFEYVSEIHSKLLVEESRLLNLRIFMVYLLIIASLILVWEVMFSLQMITFSPLVISMTACELVLRKTFWQDAYVSLSEIFGGLGLGIFCATIIYKILRVSGYLRERIIFYLPLLHITPIFTQAILIWQLQYIGYLPKTLGISLMVLYPLLEILWGLREKPLRIVIPLAIDNALPYALTMMIFGEAVASTGGLGFSMITAHIRADSLTEGIAVALILIGIYACLSEMLRYLPRTMLFGKNT